MKKMYIQTYGCQMNQYDSERIAQVMGRANYTLTDEPADADLILLNTCSVREKAEQKVYSALGTWRQIKQQKSSVIIGVGGCVAQQEGDRLLKRVPYLDLVFGTHNIHKLPEMIEQVESAHARPIEIAFYRDPSYMEDPGGRSQVQGAKAFVTIMQGCNKVCSFCIVPHVRGREVSRPSGKIIAEIKLLATQGVKEVMLLGQNVNSYGKTSADEIHFAELLRRINSIEGLSRIRFTTSHPQDLSADLVEAYASLDKLCEHLHLPVQSGSDSVLLRMRRGYTRTEYLDRIDRLRQRCPEVALSTDIIVGFPGESDDDFEETLELLGQVEYDEIYSFMYSPRTQTVSAKLYNDDVPEEKKKERLKYVQNVQQEISLRRNKEKIGRIEEVLIDGHSRNKAQIMGRTRTNRIVNITRRGNVIGEMINARIIAATANSLVGELAVQETASEIQVQGEMV
jgi:tRNA-2-methylthio-N6-dimethylallyladenosine synthase